MTKYLTPSEFRDLLHRLAENSYQLVCILREKYHADENDIRQIEHDAQIAIALLSGSDKVIGLQAVLNQIADFDVSDQLSTEVLEVNKFVQNMREPWPLMVAALDDLRPGARALLRGLVGEEGMRLWRARLN